MSGCCPACTEVLRPEGCCAGEECLRVAGPERERKRERERASTEAKQSPEVTTMPCSFPPCGVILTF